MALIIKVGPSAANYNTSYGGKALMNIYIVKDHFHGRIIILAANYTGRFYDRFNSEAVAWVSGAAETVDYFG